MTALASERLPCRRDILDEPMPQSPDYERAVIAAVMLQPKCYYRLPARFNADVMFKDAHRIIFAAVALLMEEGVDPDTLMLSNKLREQGVYEQIGGGVYISSLFDITPDIANIERYAEIVIKKADLRAQIILGNSIQRAAMEPDAEPEEIAASALQKLSNHCTPEDSQARPLIEVLGETYEAMQDLRARNASIALTSGWERLDDHKVFSKTFVVTGASAGMAKSAAMIAMTEGLASNGHPTAMISLESTPREIALRYTSMAAKIPHRLTRDWRIFSEKNFADVAECQRVAAQRPIFISRGPRAAEDIVLEVRRLKAMHNIQAVFIDYIQLVELRRRVDSREERLAEAAKMFLDVAIDLDIHVHAFSQLRDGAGKDGALSIDDLAYAKAIGKSARVVNLFRRPKVDYANSPFPVCYVEWWIRKNNEERTNMWPNNRDPAFHFNEAYQTFSENARCNDPNCQGKDDGPVTKSLFSGGANGTKADRDPRN